MMLAVALAVVLAVVLLSRWRCGARGRAVSEQGVRNP